MRHILSLGAGVQSSTLALMAAHGQVKGYPVLDAAIFADTQDEPKSVYRWLEWLEAEIAKSPNPFPVHRVTAGKLSDKVLIDGKGDVPFHLKSADGEIGISKRRACTADFKLTPILRKARELGNVPRKTKDHAPHVTQWIGISLDEIYRMKPSRDWWASNCWPLVDMRMSRHDCKRWMESMGYPEPPRSSCVFCPFHNNHEWRRLRDQEPEAWAQAVDFDKRARESMKRSGRIKAAAYIHKQCVPLEEADIDEDSAQMNFFQNECLGMCGV